MLKVNCPACAVPLHLPDAGFIGKQAMCPKCSHRFVLTSNSGATKSPPTPGGVPLTDAPPTPTTTFSSGQGLSETASFGSPLASSEKAGPAPKFPSPRSVTMPTETPLKQLGEFTLIEELGRGAFGTVYRARDNTLGRLVAIKIPKPSLFDAHDPEEFVKEARLAAQIRHPNILTIYQVGVASGIPYIVSALVEGTDLAGILKKGPLKPKTAALLCRKIALALHLAHQSGIVHRDLKPANILMDQSKEPLIADFGLAKSVQSETNTTEGAIKGTPAYMSPEQAAGKTREIDGRSDIFSLGIILYEMLAGTRPFQGGDAWSILRKIIEEPPPPLRAMKTDVPEGLQNICLRCLRKDPNDRYPSAKDLAQDLSAFLQGKAVQVPPARSTGPRMNVSLLIALSCLLLAGSGIGGWLLFRDGAAEGAKLEADSTQDRGSSVANAENSSSKGNAGNSRTERLTGRKTIEESESLAYARMILWKMEEEVINTEIVETPLRDVIDFWADGHALQIQYEDRALREEGINTDEPITLNLTDPALDSALATVLATCDLTWLPLAFGQNGKWVQPNQSLTLMITTESEARRRMETILYPIGDIVETQADVDNIIASIKQDAKTLWKDEEPLGGTITFIEQGQLLSINQTWDAHKRIISHLDRLRPNPLEGSGNLGGGIGGGGFAGGGIGGGGGGVF